MIIRGPKVFLPERGFCEADVRIVEERIAQVGPSLDGADVFRAQGYLIPGMIDIHTHGYAHSDVMQGEAAVRAMSRAYALRGVTAFLPTTTSAPPEETALALEGIAAAMQGEPGGARVLGAHLEGPFLNKVFKGAMLGSTMIPPSIESFERMCAGRESAVKLITVAPELDGAEQFIRYARSRGIAVSIGHTAATYEQTLSALDWGATNVTHLFNAMAPIHHRAPGPATAALVDPRATVQLIADGVHIHPGVLALVARAKGDGICLITDSMMAAGLEEGIYGLGGQEVVVANGEARLGDGTLAGSILTLDEALRRMLRLTGEPLDKLVPMVTQIPARMLGLCDMGAIGPGMCADLCLLDENLRPVNTWVGGTPVL